MSGHSRVAVPGMLLKLNAMQSIENGMDTRSSRGCSSPTSKILFVSENRSLDVVEKALSTGAGGYVVKSDAGSELMPAVEAVLQGKQFLSASLSADRAPKINEA